MTSNLCLAMNTLTEALIAEAESLISGCDLITIDFQNTLPGHQGGDTEVQLETLKKSSRTLFLKGRLTTGDEVILAARAIFKAKSASEEG